MKNATVSQKEIKTVIESLINGASYCNNDFQFVRKSNGLMFRYNFNKGTYTFFTDIEKFARAIVRFHKRGW